MFLAKVFAVICLKSKFLFFFSSQLFLDLVHFHTLQVVPLYSRLLLLSLSFVARCHVPQTPPQTIPSGSHSMYIQPLLFVLNLERTFIWLTCRNYKKK